ncbi:Mmr1p Ecym_4709 [Eremothecium cymbalariae DBVPG|uniref:Uncharacterized protein n=1 Tax=Eremothecium cymbalariae (strain CBS 270.75 / DBVPG 7215 / KCTC 17166 / NRRL Y-17582) TaxID=931890 RepID=G8JSK7_ERECY|nr:hypothetical protein Ecym_4709 [Eremothecium cymbalariae DBVPG\
MSFRSINIVGVPVSPIVSPMMMPLDDQKQLVAPPLLKLDDTMSAPVMYTASLSNLTRLSQRINDNNQNCKMQSARNQQAAPVARLRSTSPIRTSIINRIPKMLKNDYIMSPTPLWRDQVMKTKNSIRGNDTGSPVMTVASVLKSTSMASNSREPKVPLAEPSPPMLQNVSSSAPAHQIIYAPKRRSSKTSKAHLRELSVVSCLSGKTVCEGDSTPLNAHIPQSVPGHSYRFPSVSSVSSTSTNNLIFSPDESGFMLSGNGNRDSMASGTVDDSLWMEYQDELHHNRRMSTDLEMRNENTKANIEAEKVELRIKWLELQIAELKLQNDKLKHTMEHSAIQDKLLLDALHDARQVHFGDMNDTTEKKLKVLEKKVLDYRRTIHKLTTANGNAFPRRKVALLDDEQLNAIADDQITKPTHLAGNEINDHINDSIQTYNNSKSRIDDDEETSETVIPRGRTKKSRLRSRGLKLNLSFNVGSS